VKTSLTWLNRYLDRPADRDEAIAVLTRVGFPEDGEAAVELPDGTTETQIDFEVTSNRCDCLSHVGLARELAAATGRTLRPPSLDLPRAGGAVTDLTSVDNRAEDLCPVYTARVVTGVEVGPSPDWLQRLLIAVGARPVNNVVDITNFVLLELGQPLHAFDMAKLAERRIVVRRASKGEPFVAIDGSKHELGGDMLVIADADRPVAVAGVMGGLESEVGNATTGVLIESARFAPLSIRTTSRALKLSSDSSYRFERGVDPRGVEAASRRAGALIVELAGGTLAQGVIRAGEGEPVPRSVAMRASRCRDLLGIELDIDAQAALLGRLGLSPAVDGDTITCGVPTFRLDLHREVDLIEEVARMHGLDRVPTHDRITLDVTPKQAAVTARERLDAVLTAHGYHETITPTFVPPAQAAPFIKAGTPLRTLDDRRKADPVLRPTVLVSLLACRKLNQDAGNAGLRLYELAASWPVGDGGGERQELAMLADAADTEPAVRAMRAAVTELVEALAGPAAAATLDAETTDAPACDTAATLRVNGEPVGCLGVIDAATQDVFGLQGRVVVASLDAAGLLARFPPAHTVTAMQRYPGIERDVSIIVDEPVVWRDLRGAIDAVSPELLDGVEFVTTYRGKPIPAGRKSVSFRLRFQHPERTLRHDEVDPQVQRVIDRLKAGVGAELRT